MHVLQDKGNKQRFVCLTTEDGKVSGKYGRGDKEACKVKDGFGVGVEPRVNFIYTK